MYSSHGRRPFVSALSTLLVAFVTTATLAAQGPIEAADPAANEALETLRSATGGRVFTHVGDTKVQSQSVSSLTVTGNRATFSGSCTVNKTSGFTFTVDVVDNGPGSSDTFRIRLSNGYEASGTLGGGNITVK